MTKRSFPILPALADLLLLWLCLLGMFRIVPADRPDLWMLLAATLIRLAVGAPSIRAWRRRALAGLTTGLLFHFVWGRGLDDAALVAWFVLGALGPVLPVVLKALVRAPREVARGGIRGLKSCGRALAAAARAGAATTVAPWTRFVRIPLLLLAGAALMWPYLTLGVVGAGDALWYSNVVADFILQVRAGIFPVWVGQTDFSFLGGTFPVRMAPWLQHLAGIIDLLTGQRLPSFTLVDLALAASFMGGLLSCYFCLAAVLPRRPWTAAALAFLYATCPGVIGLAYAQDLYLSFTALPFLPVVLLGVVRSFDRDDAASRLLMAGGLAAVWLSHPPIAAWCGLVVVATQAARLFHRGWSPQSRRLDLLAVAAFAVLAGYSFVSVMSLGPRIADGSNWQGEYYQVRSIFPGDWLPLPRAHRLEMMQMGYGLAAVFVGVLVGALRRREPLLLVLGLSAAFLFALLTPIPYLSGPLWHLMPPPLLQLTKTWPMLRLPVVLALCTVFGAALLARSVTSRASRGLAGALLALAVGWSGWQAWIMAAGAGRSGQSRAASAQLQRTENLLMTRGALGVAPVVPRSFSNGVMAPELEHHFLDRLTLNLQSNAIDAIAPGFGPGPKPATPALKDLFTGKLNANPGILDLFPRLTLEPGRRYLLIFQFLRPHNGGVLIVQGGELYREYEFPPDGGVWAFGPEAENSHALPLWTSGDRPEVVQLQFVPIGGKLKTLDYTPFARFELRGYEPAQLAVELKSLMPYRAIVRSAGPAYLETPRLFVPGYEARVDGRPVPVAASKDGLVIVPLEAGTHALALDYVAPLAVRVSYWGGLVGWLLFLVVVFGLLRASPASDPA